MTDLKNSHGGRRRNSGRTGFLSDPVRLQMIIERHQVEAIDAIRDKVTRSDWIRQAIAQRLNADQSPTP